MSAARRHLPAFCLVMMAAGLASCIGTETIRIGDEDAASAGDGDSTIEDTQAVDTLDDTLAEDPAAAADIDADPVDLPEDPGAGDAPDVIEDPSDQSGDTSDPQTDPGDVPNQGWIGGPCADVDACQYADALCLGDDYPGGLCSMACTRLCPDSSDPNDAVTFCVEDPYDPGQGICTSRCDWTLFPLGGCRAGYVCVTRPRFSEPLVTRQVCLPDDGSSTTCTGDEFPLPNVGLVEPAGIGGCSPGMAPIGTLDVCIDRWEAFLVEIPTGGGQADWSPYFNPGTRRMRAYSAPGAVPQGYINEVQAEAACEEAQKRLCTEAEWVRACRGPDNTVYPYGNTRQPGVCNDARDEHPAYEYFDTHESWVFSELDHPCLNQLENSLDTTGANAGCISYDGMFDMMGNLHEWVDDPDGTFRGGYYVDTVENGNGCLYITGAHNVYHWDYSTGFRCCADL